MKDQKWLLLSHSLIGTGFIFLYIQYVRSIYESRTNIAFLTQLERESLLREDALYYSFYKTLTDEPDFWMGYNKLKNLSGIEYPDGVNVVQNFHVLPELFIGFMYHLVRYYNSWAVIPFFSCWRLNDVNLPPEHRRCDVYGQPMQFYLEVVWLLGGLTIFIIYMYATLLSENAFGGIYAVISYVMFHSYASKIYERPMARENFAFPIILMQMFYLSMCLARINGRQEIKSRVVTTLILTLFTLISLMCWQFSAIIFATQILIMMMSWGQSAIPNTELSFFIIDYALSQLFGVAYAFYYSNGNKKYIFSWQIGPAVGLFFIGIFRLLKNMSGNNEFSLKTASLDILFAVSAQGTITDLLEKTGLARSAENSFTLYHDLIVRWIFQGKVSFGTNLVACNRAYERMELLEMWDLVKTLAVRPYCMYGVVMLARFFRKWRKAGENKTPNSDHIERAKKYILEDFLEENHVSMSDMSNKETELELNECLKLLEKCDYDYERYKKEHRPAKEKDTEHKEFLNDIHKLKEEINEKKNKEKQTAAADHPPSAQNTKESANTTAEKSDDMATTAKTDHETETQTETEVETKANPSTTSAKEANGGQCAASPKSDAATSSAQSSKAKANANKHSDNEVLGFHYMYSLIQMVVFAVFGLSVKKLFFLCFTQACVMAPTITSKYRYRKQRSLFWTISLAVFATSIVHPGMLNIHEEYFSHDRNRNEELDTMLEWIKMNTEKDAVFAGPIDIIGTVHLTTKRPIVNHGHLEMLHMSERTEHIYSIFSRQQSSDIYTQCAQLKIQYLIISVHDCQNEISDECDILSIWDEIQPAYRKFPQFCWELTNKNIPSFLKVFANDDYGIIKMFSQSVQINLKYNKMPEKVM